MLTYNKIVKQKGENLVDLKDYAKTKILKEEKSKTDEKRLHNVKEDYGFLVQEFMKRYGKMDEKQMMDEMFKLVEQKKKDGTFNLEQIQNIAQTVKPFLNFEQQEYMQELIKKIS